MAPTTRRNVSKKHKHLEATRSKDSIESVTETEGFDSQTDSLISSDDELSEVDSDLEELANESVMQILSKLSTHSEEANDRHDDDTTRTKLKSKKVISNSRKPVEPLVEDEQQSGDEEIKFVIDTKPFSFRRTPSSSDDDEQEENKGETESENGEDLDSASVASTSQSSEIEKDSDDENIEESLKEKKYQKSSGSASRASLRVHISEELAKITQRREDRLELASEMDPGIDFGGSYVNYDVGSSSSNSQSQQRDSLEKILQKSQQDKLIQKSVITPDFEKQHSLPKVSFNQQKKQRKKVRDSKTGKGWYEMPAQEMTEDLRNDLRILRMRSALDPKRFYKHNDMKTLPKYVQVGTVIDSPVDYYHSRVPNKQRKQNVVDELLADAEMRRYNKRKYLELQERSRRKVEGRFAGKKLKRFKKVQN